MLDLSEEDRLGDISNDGDAVEGGENGRGVVDDPWDLAVVKRPSQKNQLGGSSSAFAVCLSPPPFLIEHLRTNQAL